MADREDRRRSGTALVCDRLDIVPVTRFRLWHPTAAAWPRRAPFAAGDCDEDVRAHWSQRVTECVYLVTLGGDAGHRKERHVEAAVVDSSLLRWTATRSGARLCLPQQS